MQEIVSASETETHRQVTRKGQVIRYFLDGSFSIYFPNGDVTYSDKRRGHWVTINHKGVKRIRSTKDNLAFDEFKKVKVTEKIDPEINAMLYIREDGVLVTKYEDGSILSVFPDST